MLWRKLHTNELIKAGDVICYELIDKVDDPRYLINPTIKLNMITPDNPLVGKRAACSTETIWKPVVRRTANKITTLTNEVA